MFAVAIDKSRADGCEHKQTAATPIHVRRLAVFLGLNHGGRRHASAREGMAIPPPHPDQARGRHQDQDARASSDGGYNSSCEMVGPLFRAINTGQLSWEPRAVLTITSFAELT